MKWLLSLTTFLFFSLEGVMIRDDVSEVRYLKKGQEKAYASVGYIHSPYGIATGTLIDPKIVLTAAHALQPDGPVKFCLWNPNTKKLEEVSGDVHIHEGFAIQRSSTGDVIEMHHDIALIYLEKPIKWVDPMSIDWHFLPDEETIFTCVGFGASGTGLSQWDVVDRKKRAFQNRFWHYTGPLPDDRLYFTYFHRPDDEKVLPLEGIAAPGDSGSPIIISSYGRESIMGLISLSSGRGLYGTINVILPIIPYKDWIEERLKRK